MPSFHTMRRDRNDCFAAPLDGGEDGEGGGHVGVAKANGLFLSGEGKGRGEDGLIGGCRGIVKFFA